MHIEFLVEELSAEAVLQEIVPKIVPHVTFKVHTHQGKQDLLRKLPSRLKAYRRWLPSDSRIVVLLDADTPEKCKELKARVEAMVHDAQFSTPSSRGAGEPVEVLVRLAVEELEAWFFGDTVALRTAYPRVPASLGKKARYPQSRRDPRRNVRSARTGPAPSKAPQRAVPEDHGRQKHRVAHGPCAELLAEFPGLPRWSPRNGLSAGRGRISDRVSHRAVCRLQELNSTRRSTSGTAQWPM